MNSSELESRNIAVSMRKSVENLVISSQDAIGQSISQALTFSGVITQHANQIINQENRNVSRSPSPSSKGTESNNSSTLENEKQNDVSLQVPIQGSSDNVSITSQVESAAVITRSETSNKATGNPSKTSESTRTKKKSWYSAFYPTYKSRSEDFRKLFKDVPDDERLIVDYSCALQKDILAHGRLYVSQNYLCFYANIFGWETSLSHRWKDVTAITKEKTALVIPNAILICTENEKNFLTSFSGRDKAYLMLFRVWQNALMDQPMSSQEIWQWVHSCYGEELGFNSDDEEYMRDVSDEEKVVAAVGHIDIAIEEVRSSLYVESCSMEGASGDDRVDKPDGGDDHINHNSVRGAGEGRRSADDGDVQPTDMSDTTDSEPDDKNNDASLVCNLNHEGRVTFQSEVPINIDQLFTMIFTNSKFNLELLAERGISDYTQTAWQHDVKVGLKCRQVKYTMSLSSGPIGPKEVYVTETQVMNKCSKPGILYSIDATSENSGIPYGDCFSVIVHYCLKRISEQITALTLYSQLKYKKSVWPMVKVFLEKNTTSGLDEYAKLLDVRLKLEAEGGAPAKRKGRRRRRVPAAQETSVPAVVQSAIASSNVSVPRGSVSRARGRNSNGTKWLIACLLVLLAINALLYWRLYISERPKGFGFEDLQDRMSTLTAEQMAEVSRALERHSHAQRDQLLAWRAALHRAVNTLKQTEQALSNLLESIKPSLDKAQQEAVKHSPLRTEL